MTTKYENRLEIPLEGNDHTRFETSTGLQVATGYTKIIIGGRRPYIEFLPGNLIWDNIHIPHDKRYKLLPRMRDRVDYLEFRTNDEANVKICEQKRTVNYADYREGMLYASPFDLFVDGKPVITK